MKQIKKAIKYPFKKWKRLFYWYLSIIGFVGIAIIVFSMFGFEILWAEEPLIFEMLYEMTMTINPVAIALGSIMAIIGLFTALAFLGYELDFMGGILKGKDKQLPKFGKFWNLFKRGFFVACFVVIISIISGLVEQLQYIEIEAIGIILYVVGSIVISVFTPILLMQYVEKEKFSNFFKFGRAWKILKNNFRSFIAMILRVIGATLFLLICSIPIITLVVTLPAMQFSSRYLVAQWYRKAKKPKL